MVRCPDCHETISSVFNAAMDGDFDLKYGDASVWACPECGSILGTSNRGPV